VGSRSAHQYSSANMIVSTRVTTGSPFAPSTSGSFIQIDLKEQVGAFDLKTAEVVLAVRVVVFDEDIERFDLGKRCQYECVDLGFEVAGQIINFKQDAVLERLMPALDLALRLRVAGRR
jgi:hypothetical protein